MKLIFYTDTDENSEFINDKNKYQGLFIRHDGNQGCIFKGFWRNNIEFGKWKEFSLIKYYL